MNCIIVHGCPPSKERALNPKIKTFNLHWLPWVKKELDKKGIKTEIPLMPEPWKPKYEPYKKEFEKYEVNENTILIGHSCGASFLVRWLGETKQKIRELILVSPWKLSKKDDEYRKKFYDYKIDETIKNRVKKIVFFTSDNEWEGGKKSLKIFHEKLGGKIIEIKGYGHYMMKYMHTEKFPELIKEI